MSDLYNPIPTWAYALPWRGPYASRRGKRARDGTPATTRVSAWGVLLLGILCRYQRMGAADSPSVDELCEETGLERRAVLDQLEALEDACALVVERASGRRSRYVVAEPPEHDDLRYSASLAPVHDGAPVHGGAPPIPDATDAETDPVAAAPVVPAAPVHGPAPVHDGPPVHDAAPDQCTAAHPTGAPACTPADQDQREEKKIGGGDLVAREAEESTTTRVDRGDEQTSASEYCSPRVAVHDAPETVQGKREAWFFREWSKAYLASEKQIASDGEPLSKRDVVRVLSEQVELLDFRAWSFEDLARAILAEYFDVDLKGARRDHPKMRPTMRNMQGQLAKLLDAAAKPKRRAQRPVAKARPSLDVGPIAREQLPDAPEIPNITGRLRRAGTA